MKNVMFTTEVGATLPKLLLMQHAIVSFGKVSQCYTQDVPGGLSVVISTKYIDRHVTHTHTHTRKYAYTYVNTHTRSHT